MAKRKSSLSTVVAFLSEEAQAQVREQAEPSSLLPLTSLLPDPAQPRQLLPVDLAQAVAIGQVSPFIALQEWIQRAEAPNADVALQHNIQELRRLANSIEKHGLINPISVRRVNDPAKVPPGVSYLIITGERRYWAHILLTAEARTIQEGVETHKPDRIKATVAAEGVSIRAHQIIENLLREDIDAVEKANGFLALRYELSGLDPDATPVLGEVNHGSPLISWNQVEETLGISKRYRSYVTAVLNLSEEARGLIKQHRLTERLIRPISQKLKDKPTLQMKALKQLVAWQGENEADTDSTRPLTASVQALVDELLLREAKTQKTEHQPVTGAAARPVDVNQFYNKIKWMLRFLDNLSEGQRLALSEALAANVNTVVVDDLRALHEYTTQLLQTVESQPHNK